MVNWTDSDLKAIEAQRATKRRPSTSAPILAETVAPSGRRLRQSLKPLLNKLETEWFWQLKAALPGVTIRAQAKSFRLCNGGTYRPDFTAIVNGVETAYETKGPKNMKGVSKGVMTVKLFAHEWPEIAVYFCWKERGKWLQQRVLP